MDTITQYAVLDSRKDAFQHINYIPSTTTYRSVEDVNNLDRKTYYSMPILNYDRHIFEVRAYLLPMQVGEEAFRERVLTRLAKENALEVKPIRLRFHTLGDKFGNFIQEFLKPRDVSSSFLITFKKDIICFSGIDFLDVGLLGLDFLLVDVF